MGMKREEPEHLYHATSQVHEGRCANTTSTGKNTDRKAHQRGVSGGGGRGKWDNKTKPALKKVDPKVTNMERNEAARPRMRGDKRGSA